MYLAYPNYFEEETCYIKNFTKTLNNEVSPLHQAILDERVYLLTTHLENPNIDLNTRNKNYETPLLAALRIQDKEIAHQLASKLLNTDADINIQDYHSEAPLHEIAKTPSNDQTSNHLLTLILKKSTCNVNIKNFLGETPLHMASTVNIANRLIQNGADINMRDNSDNTPLHRQVSNPKICELLLKSGVTVNTKNLNGFSPLHEAVLQNVEETVTLLLRHGADSNMETDLWHRLTPLMIAYRFRAKKSIKEQLWVRSKPQYLLFAANYDCTKIPRILDSWASNPGDEEKRVDFLLDLMSLLKKFTQLKWVTCGRLVAQHFLNCIEQLSHQNCHKIIKRFSECLGRSLLNFLLKTHNYTNPNSLKEVRDILTLLLQRGESLDYSDIEVIYLQFGDCALLHDLLKTPTAANLRQLDEIPLFPKVLWDVTSNLTNVLNEKKISKKEVMDFFDIHSLTRYCTLPKKLYLDFYDTYQNIIHFEKPELCTESMENHLKEIERKSGIPTLLELSRNAVRPVICQKYGVRKVPELVQVLRTLQIPSLIIDVIIMNVPLHFDIKRPQYCPHTRHSYLL